MTALHVSLWILALVATLAALAGAVLAGRLHRPALALPSLAPVAVGAVLLLADVHVPPHGRVLPVLLGVAIGALGIAAGGPLTVFVLDRTATTPGGEGEHGGILVRDGAEAPREILRGGSVIGFLERLAIVGGVAVGHPEVMAGVIALKGLGRFSELATSEARERFIIGTLVSMIWGALCGGLVLYGVLDGVAVGA